MIRKHTDISEKKLHRIETKGFLDETAEPEYYVKRDLFFPIFTKKYSFYQCHQPQEQGTLTTDEDMMPEIERISTMDTKLRNVNVKGKRRNGPRRNKGEDEALHALVQSGVSGI